MSNSTPTLLYIDDDEALARLVDRGLTRLGLKVIHAASGQAGLERIAQGGIDVVALDQYMPGLDGLETLEQILKIPDAPPVVFVTASQDSAIAVTALKAGAADYLVKDIQGEFIPLLHVAVAGALRQAALQKARDEAEAEIHASRDRFAALAAEREVLLREVNHRVGFSCRSSPRCCICRPIRRPRKASRRRSPMRWAASPRSRRCTAGSTPRTI
jgi:CheY-like chemotaxis protein